MSDKVKGVLAGSVGLVVLLAAIIFGAGYLLSDDKGLPVPTTVNGTRCWLTTKGIDVLDCHKGEKGESFAVRFHGRWWGISDCGAIEAGPIYRCLSPYLLRLDLSGSYPKVTAG